MQVAAWLKDPTAKPIGPLVALYGSERFFKQRTIQTLIQTVLGGEDPELSLTRFAGATVDYSTVLEELRTVSMFGDRRLVVVDDADEFVKNARPQLEKYLEKPVRKSILVLILNSFPSNTRLFKKVAESGLPLECVSPKPWELPKWLTSYAKETYDKQLTQDAAQTLVELAGTDLSQLDQELNKLTTYVGDKPRIDAAAVTKLVGGWKAETTWGMLDAVRDGKLAEALHLLDKLMFSGEHPLKLLGGVNYQFRPLGQVTEATRQGQSLSHAISGAGVRPQAAEGMAAYLKRIGRPRAEQMLTWLLTADRELKGGSHLPDRLIMERLLAQLSGQV